MPEQQELFLELQEFLKNVKSIPITIDNNTEKKAEEECDKYLETKSSNINEMTPLSIYYVIRKLSFNEQIEFIKNNISYIKEHDEEIFIYDMESPKSLGYHLSFNLIKEIYKIDKELINKMMNRNFYQLVNNFSQEDYLEFYTLFSDEINKLDNNIFLDALYHHNRFLYDNVVATNLHEIVNNQKKYNKEFINFILKNYFNKIKTFDGKEIIKFLCYFEYIDVNTFQKFINDNKDKLSITFEEMSEFEIYDLFKEDISMLQKILISNFYDSIIKKHNIDDIIFSIDINIIIDLYKKGKIEFSNISLKRWIELSDINKSFNDELKNILDTYEVNEIEKLFSKNYDYLESLKYIENKFRNSIEINGIIEEIDESTNIFSSIYLKNLKELKYLLNNKIITKNDIRYKKHLTNFILYLEKKNVIFDIDDDSFKEIEKLFYKIINGCSMTALYKIKNIQELTIFNRLGKVDFNVKDFTVQQLKKYNVKIHKKLCKKIENEFCIKLYKPLILKLIFIVGYKNAEVILDINKDLGVLEHLVSNINMKDIKLNECGDPIINKKIINLLFNDKQYSRIKGMLKNQDSDLYMYFPRIFNEWKIIQMNDRNKSLTSILEFFKRHNISLLPKYYRLNEQFKFIGIDSRIVNETLKLHDAMLKTNESTIPKIKGTLNEYSYEILDLHDMDGISVGSKTACCFEVLGASFSSLKHALLNKNGRILVVKKDNKLLAHSWLWRNGNLLCLDNIEISKKISEVDFFDVYLKFADEIIKESFMHEGVNECIKNVTIGYASFDKKILGINKFPCFISKSCDIEKWMDKLGNNKMIVDQLPHPLEEVKYLDSKNVQYLIKGNGDFDSFQSSYIYQDERNKILYYNNNCIDKDKIEEMNKKINALREMKYEDEGKFEQFSLISVKKLKEAYCNDDWYIIVNDNEEIECYKNSNDYRANIEYQTIKKNNFEDERNKQLVKCS